MALLFDNTADGLIQRFLSNDDSNKKWTIDQETWESLLGWTASQGRDVVNAAVLNTSIRTLEVWVVQQMTDAAIDVFSVIVGQLRHLKRVKIVQDIDDAPVPLGSLERLFMAISTCPSGDVTELNCRSCVSPRGLHALVESFPKLETLEVWGPHHPPHNCQACALAGDFALTFGAAAARGLPSLRDARIRADVRHPSLPDLLSALHTSSSLRQIDMDVPRDDADLVGAARRFFVCATSVEAFVIRGQAVSESEGEEMVLRMTDMTALFDIGPIPSFSPTITEVEFFNCDFRHADEEGLVKKVVKALQNVNFLRFGRCRFPSVMNVVEGLPRLTAFSCLSREYVASHNESIAESHSHDDPMPYTLATNHDLEDLCRAVERPGSLLDDIELDLICFNNESFPAISRLMGACRGTLVLNLGEHTWTVASHLVGGAHRLRHDLKDLRLRFANSELEDVNYSDIVRALAPNTTLAHLEIGFVPNEELETTELSTAAIVGLVDSNETLRSLSLRGLRPNGATEIIEGIMPILASTNRSLRVLELRGAVDLADILPRARALALDVLKENDVLSNLVGLDIPNGDLLHNLLLQNRYGRIFLRANHPSPTGIWATVLARVARDQQVGIMYKFLRAKPGLVRRRKCRSSSPTLSSSGGGGVAGHKRGRGEAD